MIEMSYHGPVQSHLCISPSQNIAISRATHYHQLKQSPGAVHLCRHTAHAINQKGK